MPSPFMVRMTGSPAGGGAAVGLLSDEELVDGQAVVQGLEDGVAAFEAERVSGVRGVGIVRGCGLEVVLVRLSGHFIHPMG